jgi:hypothetical protein
LELVEDDVLEVAVDTDTAVSSPCLLNSLNVSVNGLSLCWGRDFFLLQRFRREVGQAVVLTVEGLDLQSRDFIEISVDEQEEVERDRDGERSKERDRIKEPLQKIFPAHK